MAKFTIQQINNAKVLNLTRWTKSGWKNVEAVTMPIADYILSECGIYYVEIEIEGNFHKFYSKGAKTYGLEYLD